MLYLCMYETLLIITKQRETISHGFGKEPFSWKIASKTRKECRRVEIEKKTKSHDWTIILLLDVATISFSKPNYFRIQEYIISVLAQITPALNLTIKMAFSQSSFDCHFWINHETYGKLRPQNGEKNPHRYISKCHCSSALKALSNRCLTQFSSRAICSFAVCASFFADLKIIDNFTKQHHKSLKSFIRKLP